VTAVAVWDKHPTADEILEHRLSQGWKPTASALQAGDEIIGHAACVLK
jgi:hypothetical protein